MMFFLLPSRLSAGFAAFLAAAFFAIFAAFFSALVTCLFGAAIFVAFLDPAFAFLPTLFGFGVVCCGVSAASLIVVSTVDPRLTIHHSGWRGKRVER
jgi:hypothetical protein